MKLAISGQVLGKIYDLAETLAVIRSYKVKYIEIWPVNLPLSKECGHTDGIRTCQDTGGVQIGPFGDGGKNCPDSDGYRYRDAVRAKELLDEYGIGVSAVSFSGAFSEMYTGDTAFYADELCRAVETAAILGAGTVNHYCYGLSRDNPDEKRLEAAFLPALRLAGEKGIILALENEAHDATRTPEGMRRILELFRNKAFQTTYDSVNYYQAGQEGFPYAYEILKDKIAYVHLKNGCIYRPGNGGSVFDAQTDSSVYRPRQNHQARFMGGPMTGILEGETIYYTSIEDGSVNMEGELCRLERDGYDGYYTLEPHCPPEDITEFLDRDLAYLKNREELEGR